MSGSGRAQVEVVLAWPRRAKVVVLNVAAGTTVSAVVRRSGVLATLPAEVVSSLSYAIHGRAAEGDTVVKDGDRVELLRRLTVDPKESRRRRAALRASKGSQRTPST